MEAGTRLKHYTIVSCLGSGGMGMVYRARDERLGRDVALKMLPPRHASDGELRQRLEREARLVASLSHPNIAAIHGLEECDGSIFLVLELVDGIDLARRLESGPFPVTEALEVAVQVADAVSAAHQQGILHCDLKPANLMLSAGGRVRVLDFGVATLLDSPDVRTGDLDTDGRVTGRGLIDGTPPYMSPEQIRQESLDRRTDIWALGCILFEMLAGRRAFDAPTVADTLTDILEKEPAWEALPPALPEGVRVLLRQMLHKDPARRLRDVADARLLLRGTLDSLTGIQPPPAARLPRRRAAARAGITATAVAAGALLVGAGAAGWGQGGLPGGWLGRGGGAAAPAADRLDSVAVLPFENLTGDPAHDHFADGMTEELTTELGHIDALKVVSRSSARVFRDRQLSVPEIGERLGVAALVEASLLGVGDSVRLSVRLVDAARDRQLWGETYAEPAGDLERLHARIAEAIATGLDVDLTPDDRLQLAATRAVAPEAVDAYLKGRYWVSRGGGRDEAIAEFRRAVAVDADYAAAYAALASALVYELPSHTSVPEARRAAEHALALNGELGEAHAALALVRLFFDWDWAGAEEEFGHALRLDPSSALVRQRYATLLWATGRFDAALAQLERARELDPLNLFIQTEIGRTHYFARRFDAAVREYERILELDADFWWARFFLGLAHHGAGREADAAREFVAAQRIFDAADADRMEAAYRASGYEGMLRELLEMRRAEPVVVQPTSMAALHADLGQLDDAFAWLERAADERTRALVYLAVEPQYDPLRGDPRFDDLLRRMGLTR